MDGGKILSRLDVPGLILMAAGAVACFAAPKIAARFFPGKAEKAALTLKWVGLALVLVAALLLLDVFG